MSRELLRVRLPADLKKWLRDRASANDRSMNAELVTVVKAAKVKAEKAAKREAL